MNKNQLPEKYREMVTSGVVMYFKTGELNVTSTRESLDYRGNTTVLITQTLDTISEFIEKHVESRLAASGNNLWYVQEIYNSVRPFLHADNDLSESFKGGYETIPSSFSAYMVDRWNLSPSKKEVIDYSKKFSIVLTRTKKVNIGRLDSFFADSKEAAKDDDGLDKVYVIRVPKYAKEGRAVVYFDGPDGLVKFIDWVDRVHPQLMIKSVLNKKYDLQSWPISDLYKAKSERTKKKFTSEAIELVGDKWRKVESSRLERLKKMRGVYYIAVDDLKARPETIGLCGVMKDGVIIAVTEKSVGSVPDNWKPYWETLEDRLGKRLIVAKKRLSRLNKAPAADISGFFSPGTEIHQLYPIRYCMPPFLRKFIGGSINNDTPTPIFVRRKRVDLDDFYEVLNVIRVDTFPHRGRRKLLAKLLSSYRGPGSLHDRTAFKKMISSLRNKLCVAERKKVESIQNTLKSLKQTQPNKAKS